MLPKSFSVLLDTFDDDDYDRAYASIESAFSGLQAEIADLRGRLMDWENEEGSVCPEDVGFAEYIRLLEKKVTALTDRLR